MYLSTSGWVGTSITFYPNIKYSSFHFFYFQYRFFLHLNNLPRENINRNNNNNNKSDNLKIEAYKIQDGLSQSAFCYNRRSWKRQLDSGTPGLLNCLHACVVIQVQTCTANLIVLTSLCLLPAASNTPDKHYKVGITVWSYGMFPKLV